MKNESIGLSEEAVKGVCHILNENLSDEVVLLTKTRNFHWNVTGPDFAAMHKFFDEQYEALSEFADEVAERARAVGGFAFGTLEEFSSRTHLKENPGRRPDALGMIAELAADHESIIRRLRGDISTCSKKYKDEGTANFLTDLMEKHEEMAWMLRSHLQSGRKTSNVGGTRAVDLTGDFSGAGE
jgi:starvation-inducible DNA-binding protein